MPSCFCRWARAIGRVVLCGFGSALIAAGAGCSPTAPLVAAGLDLKAPKDWKPVSLETWPVPGQPIGAWAGPNDASAVAYTVLPAPGLSSQALATALTTRMENMPELKVLGSKLETVDGLEAARVAIVAPGTGACLAPSGMGKPLLNDKETTMIPTRRIVVLIPRRTDTIGIVWHAPESSASWLDGQVAETLKTLKVRRSELSTSSY